MGKDGPDPVTFTETTYILQITFCPEKNEISVKGPFDNCVLYLGMLEAAKLNLLGHRAAKAAGKIVAPPAGLRL